MRYETRPLAVCLSFWAVCLSFLGGGGRIKGMRHGLYALQSKASRLQLGVSRKPMDIDQVFQAQRLKLRK